MHRARNFIVRVGLMGVLLVVAVAGGTAAFFGDTESSVGNVFAVGGIDLKIDNHSWYNGVFQPNTSWELSDLTDHLFFDFTDLKPGDLSEDTISLHVDDNDAWMCANMTLTESADNGINEPEGVAGDVSDGLWNGELDEKLQFLFWADDGNNVLEVGENILLSGSPSTLPQNPGTPGVTYTIADSANNVFSGQANDPLDGATTHYIGKAWCFGTLTPAPLAAGTGENPAINPGVLCDGSLETNITQTDSVRGDISFFAIQSRDLPDYRCGQGEPTPTPSPIVIPTPTPIACTEVWANGVTSAVQGNRKNGSDVLVDRSDPTQGLVSQSTGAAFDSPILAGTFFSLGFGGTVTVEYTNPINNVAGNDVTLFEVTGGPIYPDEVVQVEASIDNLNWITLAPALIKDGGVDLGILLTAKYIRVTDVSSPALFEDTADAYDLDGVRAVCGTPAV